MNNHTDLMIYFNNEQNTRSVTYSLKMLIRYSVEATLAYEQYGNACEVSVTLTDNKKIHALNLEHRGVDKPTDVLSFPLVDFTGESEEPALDEPVVSLGDIVISLEKAAEQAEEYGHSFQREVAFLCVHSMLHLLGYDHETSKEDDADMRRRQRDIMEMLGLGIGEQA